MFEYWKFFKKNAVVFQSSTIHTTLFLRNLLAAPGAAKLWAVGLRHGEVAENTIQLFWGNRGYYFIDYQC